MEMNLGLLLCDHVPDGLTTHFKDYPEMYESAFSVFGKKITWSVFDVCKGELPSNLEALEGYVVTGSRFSVNDNSVWISDLKSLIEVLSAKKIPMVGICFGHQLIAKSLGGVVDFSKTGWGVGCKNFHIVEKRIWMADSGVNLIVPAFHQEQIVRLPPGAINLASTDYCENFLVEFNEHTLGIQGHPEFEREYISALLGERVAILPDNVRLNAEASLELVPDNFLIRNWILNFLKE